MPQQSGITQILFMYVPIFLIFYFLIIRPQRQQQKKIKDSRDGGHCQRENRCPSCG